LLTLFEEMQTKHIARRDRLLDAFIDDWLRRGGSAPLGSLRLLARDLCLFSIEVADTVAQALPDETRAYLQ
jgi:hypothetical protein